ncbi:MAG: shikimate kinase [Nitrososphaeraceae archaeon]
MKIVSSIALVHGAISILNAISIGRGSALGISLKVRAKIELKRGEGRIIFKKKNSSLFRNIIHSILPNRIIRENDIYLKIDSEIPIGYGLKSSSAVSNAVSLACYNLLDSPINDFQVLNSAVSASKKARVTITGAFDDASACYYGGFVVTNNYSNRLIRRESCYGNLYAIILIPNNSTRGDIMTLKIHKDLFNEVFKLVENCAYWKAMNMNGVLVSSLLSYDYTPIISALKHGAISASISGNGPSIAVVTKEKNVNDIMSNLNQYGQTIVSKINNKKASVRRIIE